MGKPTKFTLSKAEPRAGETLLDKISRAAWEIVEDEAEERQLKTDRLRKARLEREASGEARAAKATAKGGGNASGTKATEKS
jgi:hypothetical protein